MHRIRQLIFDQRREIQQMPDLQSERIHSFIKISNLKINFAYFNNFINMLRRKIRNINV